jgi:hypothetical protein
MEKNWERSAKVFSDKLVFDNGPVYLNECYAIVKEHLHSQTCYVEGT